MIDVILSKYGFHLIFDNLRQHRTKIVRYYLNKKQIIKKESKNGKVRCEY